MIGNTIGGYRIEAEIGRGGQAVVYMATQLSFRRLVALKVVSASLSADEAFLDRFEREWVAAAALKHPNVVQVYEAGKSGDLAYLAMEFIEGPTLEELLAQGELPVERALGILRQVADALDYANRRGLVHRDVKPANVLVESGDHAYLVDFGVARARAESRLTRPGLWLGTPDYMAPEQISGKEVTAAVDRYALGAMAYEMLTGHAPFEREERAALIYAHLHQEPAPASSLRPGLPAAVDDVLARALAKEPNERYPSAMAMSDALGHAVSSAAAAAPQAAAVPQAAEVPPPAPPAPALAEATMVPRSPGGAKASPAAAHAESGGRRELVARPARKGWALGGAAGVLVALAVVLGFVFLGGDDSSGQSANVLAPPAGEPAAAGDAAHSEGGVDGAAHEEAGSDDSQQSAGGATIGAIIPADIEHWRVAAVHPEPLNLTLPAGLTVEGAGGVRDRNGEVGQLVGVEAASTEDAAALLTDLAAQVGTPPVGEVDLASGPGMMFRSQGAHLVLFRHDQMVFVTIAGSRDGVEDLAVHLGEVL